MNRFLLFVVLISLTSLVVPSEADDKCKDTPDKPFWNENADGGAACEACVKPKPKWNTDTKVCEACPDDKEWKNNKCEAKAGSVKICKDDKKPNWNTATKACVEACKDGEEWKNNKCVEKAKAGSSHSEAVIALITLNVFL